MASARTRVLLAIAFAAVAIAGAGGYFVGAGAAPTAEDAAIAQAEAGNSALEMARAEAFAAGSAKGRTAGRQHGRGDGLTDGRADGRNDGSARVETLEAEATEATATVTAADDCSDPSALPTPPGCPVPPDGPCGLYAELHPDGSCGPKAPDPATPEECPAGWHPAGIYGACAPD